MEQWLKDKLNTLKIEKGCVDCGYNANAGALHFDHLSPKQRNVSQCFSWAMVEEEMSRCVLRCANCHAVKTWPHLAKDAVLARAINNAATVANRVEWVKPSVKLAITNGVSTRKGLITAGFARGSVDRAIKELIDEGFIARLPGQRKGWSINKKEALHL